MAKSHLTLILAAALAANVALPARAADPMDCRAAAEEWAAGYWHMDARLKVPIYAAVGWLVGRPALFAVIAANAESPRERGMIRRYTAWCEGGFIGEAPRVGPAILELF